MNYPVLSVSYYASTVLFIRWRLTLDVVQARFLWYVSEIPGEMKQNGMEHGVISMEMETGMRAWGNSHIYVCTKRFEFCLEGGGMVAMK